MGKQNLYDAGMKVPLIFAGPGILHGKSDALVYLHDIYPTICEQVGISPPAGLDGLSFKPVLDGKSKTARDSLFFAYLGVQRAIRDRDWKLIRYPQINKTQLFDLKTDPDEMRDLAGQPGQTERIASLMESLASWQKQLGDPQPLSVSEPKPMQFKPPEGADLDKLLARWKMTR
jgi:arylsulfatase A-like enzyme